MIEWFEKAIDFSNILNTSITASWLILVVIGLRLILKKAPKWVNVALWGIVALRLLMPFSIESPLSLVPSVETVSDQLLQAEPEYSHGEAQLDIITNPNYGSFVTMDLDDSMDSVQWSMVKMSLVWYAGIAAMSIYTLMSFIVLRSKLRTAVIFRDNLFQCETVSSPFVLGILKPKIYLPYGMDDQSLSHVIAHEQAHIRRKDHWWKPLGFLLLTIHWFNPLMWIAYILLCRDIELACDEKVIAELGNEQRADYTQALVACAVNRRIIAACPLAFGEVGVKERVKSVMNYKKPAFWIIITALVVCVVVAVCFLTDPTGTSLTKWKIDEVNLSDTLEDIHSMTVRYYEDSITCNESEINRFIATMDKIKVGGNSISQSRDENRDHTFTISIDDSLHLHFSFDFSEIWVDDGVKPSFSYPITNPETARELMLDFSFTQRVTVEQWFDYSLNPSEMQWDGRMEANIPEFPDVTFRWYPEKMDAITEHGITTLYTGMPIWSAYFCDLTGDGVPEICSQVSFGSGIIDNRVIIHDYANGASYSLIDRGYHDYYLLMNEADGYLYVDKKVYNSNELVSTGRLVYKDGCIMVEETDIHASLVMVPTDTKLQGLHAGALLLPIDGNTYRYLLTDNTGEGVTAEKLIFEFKEPDLKRTIDWEVYSLKEYPDLSVVMMVSKDEGPWLCTYSPPGRCSDIALNDAIKAGYVVMEDGVATHGQDVWKTFYEDTQKGKEASVVVAHYQTLDPERCDTAYFEAFNQDYPFLNLYRLTFDGNTYTLSFTDSGVEYTRTFEYLMKYEASGTPLVVNTEHKRIVHYALTHDTMHTWEELWGSLASSASPAAIDFYPIYAER